MPKSPPKNSVHKADADELRKKMKLFDLLWKAYILTYPEYAHDKPARRNTLKLDLKVRCEGHLRQCGRC